jgi:GNAT superfamily N-acetyltransferase
MPYRFGLVDTDDEDVVELLRELHFLTFADTAPQPDYENGSWWIGHDGRQAVAFCGMVPSSYGPGYAYLKRAGVVPGHHGNGLQRRMIQLRERKARALGFHTSITDTTDNPASSNSLIARGYRLWLPPVPWSFANALYWRKKL